MTPNTPMTELPVDLADTFAPTMPDNWPAVLESRAAAAHLRDTKGTVDLLRATAVYLRQQAPSQSLRAPAGEVCPQCGREKAQNAGDAARGLCPKWWAVRDNAAYEDCRRHASPPSEGVKVTDEMLAARDFIADVTARADSLGIGMAKYPTAEIKLLLSALEPTP